MNDQIGLISYWNEFGSVRNNPVPCPTVSDIALPTRRDCEVSYSPHYLSRGSVLSDYRIDLKKLHILFAPYENTCDSWNYLAHECICDGQD